MSNEQKFEDVLINPSAVFAHPGEVLRLDYFTHAQKMEILRQWERDARALEVAEEEGMVGDGNSHLDEVVKAIEELDAGCGQPE